MAVAEDVAIRVALLGRPEFVTATESVKKALGEMGGANGKVADSSKIMSGATKAQEAALREVAAATEAAVGSQKAYEAALTELADAERVAAGEETELAAKRKANAEASVAATRAQRDASVATVTASKEAAAAEMNVAERTRLANVEKMSSYEAFRASSLGSMLGVRAASTGLADVEAENAAKIEAANARKVAAFDAVGKHLGMIGAGMIGVAGVVAGATVKMAADFESQTQRLVSSAGEVEGNLDLVRKGIIGLAGQVGYSTTDLANAMYKVESGGQHGAAGLQVLKAAAQGAKAENADLTVVADAVTSALTDYHLKAGDAATVTSKLVSATASGKMTFEELSRSMANILPVASAAHVSLDDILADEASMTMHGMTAQRASMNLANAIRSMQAPSQVQQKEFALLGLNAQQVSDTLGTKGLSGAVNLVSGAIQKQMGPGATNVVLSLTNALKGLAPPVRDLGQKLVDGSIDMGSYTKAAKGLPPELQGQAMSFAALAKQTHNLGGAHVSGAQVLQTYAGALNKAMGGATGMNVALMIGGENAKNTAGAYKAVSGATAEAGNNVKSWSEIQGTFNQRASEAKNGLGALAITVGQQLLPIVSALLVPLGAVVGWLSRHQTVALVLTGIIVGVFVTGLVLLTVAMWGWVTALGATAAGLIGVEIAGAPMIAIIFLIVAAVILVGVLIWQLVSHWSEAWGAVSGAVSKAWDAVTGAISTGWSKVTGFFSRIWADITGFFSKWGMTILMVLAPFIGIPIWIITHWGQVVDFFKKLPGRIAEFVGYMIGATLRFLILLPSRIKQFATDAGHWLRDTGVAILRGLILGLTTAISSVIEFFVLLPGRLLTFAKDAGNWLKDTGRSIIRGLILGLTAAVSGTIEFFVLLPGRIRGFFRDAGTWLKDTGRDILNGLILGLTGAVTGVLSWVAGLVGKFIDGFKKGMGINSPSTIFASFGGDILRGLVQGLEKMVGTVIGWIVSFVQRFVSGFKKIPSEIAAVALFLWHGVIEPVVHGIDNAFDWVVGQLKSAGDLIMNGLRLVGSIFMWLWQHAVLDVAHGIDAAFDWVTAQLKAAGDLIISGLKSVGSFFTWLFETAVHNAVTNISNIWHWLYDTVIKPVGDTIKTVVHDIGQAFSDTVDWIKRTWQTIADIVRVPVSFVVNTVYSKGIKPVWDSIAGLFGLPGAPPAPAFAGGGIAGEDNAQGGAGVPRAALGRVMPGYEPGFDRFNIRVGGGEAIMVPEWTRAVMRHFGPSEIERQNHAARAGRNPFGHWEATAGNLHSMAVGGGPGAQGRGPGRGYADGGVPAFADGGAVGDLPAVRIPAQGPDVSIGADILKSLTSVFDIPELITNPEGYFAGLFRPFTDPLNGMGTSRFMQSMKDVPSKAIGGIVQKVKDYIASWFSSGSATIGPMSASHVLDIKNAAKAKGLGRDAAVIATMTGIQESGIKILANSNVPASLRLFHEGVGHDHDSTGIFQQRQSWGPLPLTMNPFGSAELFFNKLGHGPYGDYGAAAQRVQVSAFPGAYSGHRGQAEGLVGAFGGGGIVGVSGGMPFGGYRAVGGGISPGSAYMVGEDGPELVTPSNPGTVVPADLTSAIGGDGGPDTRENLGAGRRGDVHFYAGSIVVNAAPSPQATAQLVAEAVSDRMARQ